GDALIVGGVADHLHALIRLLPSVSLSDAMRVTKTNTSLWVHETWPDRAAFAWQGGYAGFSVSRSNKDAVVEYIANQEAHHQGMSYQDELRELLRRHDVEFDERYLWD